MTVMSNKPTDDELVSLQLQRQSPQTDRPSAWTIPPPPSNLSPNPPHAAPSSATSIVTWIAPGQSVTVRDWLIRDGMVYVGAGGSVDAALIDPTLDAHFDPSRGYNTRHFVYSPRYYSASAEARGAYLQWLAEGKKAKDADIDLVFLYFYGLERRVLVDGADHPLAVSELEKIRLELGRLLRLYNHDGVFQSSARSLNKYVQAQIAATSPPPVSPPNVAKSWDMPFAIKRGLAQLAVAEQPISGEWAFAWWLHNPGTRPKITAIRCPNEFKQLFVANYQQQYPAGLQPLTTKTALTKFSRPAIHHPASPSLTQRKYRYAPELPDLSTLKKPAAQLQAIADGCYEALDRYNRHLGRKPENAGKLDALLELPTVLWPQTMQQPLLKIHSMVAQTGLGLAIQFEKLLALLPPWQTVNKSSYAAFARALAPIGLGLEPDPLFGGAVPTRQQTVVLFVGSPQALQAEPRVEYQTAALSLHLAAAVSLADGAFGLNKHEAVLRQLDGWLHLDDGERIRLQAYLRWLSAETPNLNGLKKRIEDLPTAARQALGDFLVLIAKADDFVSPAEVKLLERIFKLLGLDTESLYSKLHAAAPLPASRSASAAPAAAATESFALDMARVSVLQEDTRRVSDLLHNIFSATDTPVAAETAEPAAVDPPSENTPGLLGLSHEFSEFVRVLVSRSQWRRSELEALAADRGLLLDGSLEHINEAAFERFDHALVEGDDPLEINLDLVGELTA